jgi:hypothetical protein
VVPCGPFTALFDRSTDLIWLSYAVPSAPLPSRAETVAALEELRHLFAARKRTLRFEFYERIGFRLLPTPQLNYIDAGE